MTEKLFTGTLNHNQNKKQKKPHVSIHFRRKQGKLATEKNQTEYKIRYHAIQLQFRFFHKKYLCQSTVFAKYFSRVETMILAN